MLIRVASGEWRVASGEKKDFASAPPTFSEAGQFHSMVHPLKSAGRSPSSQPTGAEFQSRRVSPPHETGIEGIHLFHAALAPRQYSKEPTRQPSAIAKSGQNAHPKGTCGSDHKSIWPKPCPSATPAALCNAWASGPQASRFYRVFARHSPLVTRHSYRICTTGPAEDACNCVSRSATPRAT